MNKEEKIKEVMELVRLHGAAWFVSGQSQKDGDGLYFETKAQGHLFEIESKLRELIQ